MPIRSGTSARAARAEIEIVRVVDQQPGVGVARKRGELRQRRAVAVHREHALGHDQRAAMRERDAASSSVGDVAEIVVPERMHCRRATAARRSTGSNAPVRRSASGRRVPTSAGAMPALAR